MNHYSTVTQKGQITIPKKIREQLGIKKYGKVSLDVKNDILQISPVLDILDLAGSFKISDKKSVLDARKEFEKNYKRV